MGELPVVGGGGHRAPDSTLGRAESCQTSSMSETRCRRRRSPERVVGLAALVGLASGAILALPALLIAVFLRAVNDGDSTGQAFAAMAITDGEDWELIPVFLAGAILVGAVTSVAAVAVWWEVVARLPGRPWVARVAAGAVGAALPLLLLSFLSNWLLALAVAVPAALVSAIASPLVGYERLQGSSTPAVRV